MPTNDEKIKEAMLLGKWELLDELENEMDSNTDDSTTTDDVTAKTDEVLETDVVDLPNDVITDDNSEKEPAVNGDQATDDISTGDTSTPAEIATDIEGKISFDDDGNAIVPKELLAVISKDGKHEIPYGVLESTRSNAKEARTALEQEKALREEAESKLNKTDRQSNLLKKQLEDAGIDPDQLPEDIKLTPELIKSLDEYGDLGKVLKAVAAKQGMSTETPKEANKATEAELTPDPRFDEYNTYANNNPKFKAIMDNEGSDEQETLEHFYSQVSKSPEFKDKPLSEQLDEAYSRTTRIMSKEPETATQDNEEIKELAKQKVQEAKETATPASPSEVGNVVEAKGSALDRAKAASGEELINIINELSPSEVASLLDELD